jgi:hypothetical protein
VSTNLDGDLPGHGEKRRGASLDVVVTEPLASDGDT